MNIRSILGILLVSMLSCKKKGEPNISFSETEKFFQVQKGDKHISTFEYQNSGNGILRISSVNATCGCTSIDFDSSGIGPGEHGEIKVTYDSNIDNIDQVQKAILVESNTVPRLTTLYLSGKIQ